MRYIYVTLLAGILHLTGTTELHAQQRPQPLSIDTLVAREARFMQEQLSLSQEQVLKVQAILKNTRQQRVSIQDQRQQDTIGYKQKLQSTYTTQQAGLRAILTQEQWELYEKGLEERKARFLQHAKENNIKVIDK